MKAVIFDFDGTLIKGDSTKILFRKIYKKKVYFFINYYLRNPIGLCFAFFGYSNILRESRRKLLVQRCVNKSIKEVLGLSFSTPFFTTVKSQLDIYVEDSYLIYIISAGYKEIIQGMLGKSDDVIVLANSLHDVNPNTINFYGKVQAIEAYKTDFDSVAYAYGNSSGDIPMLQLAEKAFWVDENGEISEYSN